MAWPPFHNERAIWDSHRINLICINRIWAAPHGIVLNFQRTALKFAWQLCLPSLSAHSSLHKFAFNLARAQISNKYLWQKNNSQSDKIVWSANAQCPPHTHTHTRMHTQFVYIIAYTQPFTRKHPPTHTHTYTCSCSCLDGIHCTLRAAHWVCVCMWLQVCVWLCMWIFCVCVFVQFLLGLRLLVAQRNDHICLPNSPYWILHGANSFTHSQCP